MKKKRPRGRPLAKNPKSSVIRVRVSASERKSIEKLADQKADGDISKLLRLIIFGEIDQN